MNWIDISESGQIADIVQNKGAAIIFKHSTRCFISDKVKRNFESEWSNLQDDTPTYYLDIIQYRDISNLISETFKIHHESPQLLLLHDGACVFAPSHSDIDAEEISTEIKNFTKK